MGWPVGPHYAANSNVTLAPGLKGKLLLIVGEMDTNVRGILTTAASTSTSTASRVRSALYAAAAAPQYEIER